MLSNYRYIFEYIYVYVILCIAYTSLRNRECYKYHFKMYNLMDSKMYTCI